MTDRELLELASKAAGLDVFWWPTDDPVALRLKRNNDLWNPLTDDGDAFRLAVKLRLHAKHFSPLEDDFDMQPPGMVEVWQEDGEDPLHIEYFKLGDDRLIITRRAIVRAAAELGRSMK